jgi:hypothetical protein
VIPLFIGIAFIINGIFVSKKIVEASQRQALLERSPETNLLPSRDTSEFVPTQFSVTEETTRHLSDSKRS